MNTISMKAKCHFVGFHLAMIQTVRTFIVHHFSPRVKKGENILKLAQESLMHALLLTPTTTTGSSSTPNTIAELEGLGSREERGAGATNAI